MTENLQIGDIIFTIRPNPKRKNIAVGLDDDGSYYIACPYPFDIDRIQLMLTEQIDSLKAKLSRAQKNNPVHRYLDGETFYLRGELLPLIRTQGDGTRSLRIKNGAFLLSTDCREEGYGIFEKWYSHSLYDDLRRLLPLWTKTISVAPKKIQIKTVKTIWGSCSSSGNITFSVRLALVPQQLLEYIIVHELCHMKKMNHSAEFWAEVEKYLPDYKKRRNDLKKDSAKYYW